MKMDMKISTVDRRRDLLEVLEGVHLADKVKV